MWKCFNASGGRGHGVVKRKRTDDVDCISARAAAAAEWFHCLSEIASGLSLLFYSFIPMTLALLFRSSELCLSDQPARAGIGR